MKPHLNLKNKEEHLALQKTGELPVFSYTSEQWNKFQDRWTQASRLFERMNTQVFNDITNIANEGALFTEWRDEDLPEKIYSYRHEGSVIGYDEDYMVGPHDWEHEDDPIGDYVMRKKLYIYPWTGEKVHEHIRKGGAFGFSELLYFIDMHKSFMPFMESLHDLFQDQPIKRFVHKLMVIEYSTPCLDMGDEVEHRAHNTDRFGGDHCDETLAGYHLGENYVEFEARNPATDEWQTIPGLTEQNTLLMFGEHSEQSGFKPTYHRMIHNPDPSLGTRYSIIFDLQARYD